MTEALIARRRAVLGRHTPLLYTRPLHLVSGSGAWVTDSDGRHYLDCYNNVPHVGHCHPAVVAAIARQAALLNINTRYLHETIVDYAERLTATFDAPLSSVHFTCTGTEANELALRIAAFVTRAQGVIVTTSNYHGNSSVLSALTTAFPVPEAFPDFARAVAAPDPYRSGLDPVAEGDRFVADIGAAVASLATAGVGVRALLLDTILSTEGLPTIPTDALARAVALVRAAGGMFIADEVQPGFGRMGDAMWGYQHHNIVPDIVTLGKPMGNGHPIAAVVTSDAVIETFGAESFYFNTFAGNPVSCAAALAVLDVIAHEGLVKNAARVGSHLRAGLGDILQRHRVIGDIRGRGLFVGMELVEDASGAPAESLTMRVVDAMRDEGVLVSRIGPHGNILKLRPPMVLSKPDADRVVEALDTVLERLS